MSSKHEFRVAQRLFDAVVSLSINATARKKRFGYRGHGDARYQLIPSFMRSKSELDFLKYESCSAALLNSSTYRIFYQTANDLGASLPLVSSEKHRNYSDINPVSALEDFTDEAESYYDSDDLEIMAFAQHYGLPTPLLDWSRSPLVAMYFAASDGLKKIIEFLQAEEFRDWVPDNDLPQKTKAKLSSWLEPKRISVWRADIEAISEMVRAGEIDGRLASMSRGNVKQGPDFKYRVDFFTPRTQGNDNIVAQQGFFSIHHPVPMSMEYRYGKCEPVCLSDVVACYSEWHRTEGKQTSRYIKSALQDEVLQEFSLPYSEVPALMNLLAGCGIHAGSIYPGHSGCAARVRERGGLALAAKICEQLA